MYSKDFVKIELFKLEGQLEGLWRLMSESMDNEELEKILRLEIEKTNTLIRVAKRELNY